MSRLIDADVAVENIEGWLNSVGTVLIRNGLSCTCDLMGCIEDAPTIDAVPVVRCEKCVLHGNCVTEDAFIFAGIENSFCCAGKRKEGADNEP